MQYNFNGKILTIPDKDIEKYVKKLDIPKEEAIEMWLNDNDYTENEVVEQLTEKAKSIRRYEKSDKARKPSTKERKVDAEKSYLLSILMEAIKNEDCIDSVKNEAEFSFRHGENSYTVKLVKHRPPKK